MLIACFDSQHYLAAALSIDLEKDTCIFEGDGFVTLPFAVILGSTHMLLSVRWIAMLPSQFLYMGVSPTLGLHTRMAVFNSVLLCVFVLCISIGKLQLELTERPPSCRLLNVLEGHRHRERVLVRRPRRGCVSAASDSATDLSAGTVAHRRGSGAGGADTPRQRFLLSHSPWKVPQVTRGG